MRSLYLTDKSIDGSPSSINPGSPCKAVAAIKRQGFDTVIVRFVDIATPTAPQLAFMESVRDCAGLTCMLMVRPYVDPYSVIQLWETGWYAKRIIDIDVWAVSLGFPTWSFDAEWYGVYPWAKSETAPLDEALGALIHAKIAEAVKAAKVKVAAVRPSGSSSLTKTVHPYAAFSDTLIGKTQYKQIVKPDGTVIFPPPSVYPSYINVASKTLIPAVQATKVTQSFVPNGSQNTYHTWGRDELPAGNLFCYVDERDIVAFLS